EALRVVLMRVRLKRFDTVICLGDFVGYGAQPNQILDAMRMFKGKRRLYIRGNHDRVAAGLDDANGFNHAAKSAVLDARASQRAESAIPPRAAGRPGRSRRDDALPRLAVRRG